MQAPRFEAYLYSIASAFFANPIFKDKNAYVLVCGRRRECSHFHDFVNGERPGLLYEAEYELFILKNGDIFFEGA